MNPTVRLTDLIREGVSPEIVAITIKSELGTDITEKQAKRIAAALSASAVSGTHAKLLNRLRSGDGVQWPGLFQLRVKESTVRTAKTGNKSRYLNAKLAEPLHKHLNHGVPFESHRRP